MEYYYCPSLLKFLRYLWVSAAGRLRVGVLLLPSSASRQVRLLALPVSSVCFLPQMEERCWGKGWRLADAQES